MSSEAVPFAKTGGLGDVAGVMPRVMAQSEKVSLMLPDYMTEGIKKSLADTVDRFSIAIGRELMTQPLKKPLFLLISPFFLSTTSIFSVARVFMAMIRGIIPTILSDFCSFRRPFWSIFAGITSVLMLFTAMTGKRPWSLCI